MKSNNKFLLFDLGGVIINLNTQLTVQSFAKLSGRSEEAVETAWHKEEVFKNFERGELTDDDFRIFLRDWLKKPFLSDAQIDEAWNAMILDLPKERLDYLLRLKENYTVLLLSNTNNIHMHCVNKRVQDASGEKDLNPYFHRSYYSHLIGMRKPEPVIYHHILKEHNITADQLLFLDDSIGNLKGAESIGIKTLEVKDPAIIFRLEEYV
ncbi:MAG: HAD family hydrolase [Candidatus Cyclobacteriaceae bacterium M2_1C_046]